MTIYNTIYEKNAPIYMKKCSRCNSALGYFNDDIDLMRKAIKYIEEYNVIRY